MRNYLPFSLLLITLFISCTSTADPTPAGGFPTPTQHPAFASATDNSILEAETSQPSSTSQPLPSPIPTSLPFTPTSVPQPTRELLTSIDIYADSLDPDWTIQEDMGMDVEMDVTDVIRGGRTAVSLTPNRDFGMAFFTINENSRQPYLRDEVVEISFWLNGGNRAIDPNSIIVTMAGSNNFPYWVEDDKSVINRGDTPSPFSKTQLYFLGFDNAIPPQTWVEVRIRLDELLYDPEYRYVTGFFIQNDEGFFQTIYIDDVKIKMRSR